jgi:predicted metal-dependent hydrolase
MPNFPPEFEGLGTSFSPKEDTVLTQGYSNKEFEGLLETAVAYAETEWEEDFTEDISARFRQWGAHMYLSDAQRDQLERIAGGGE